jgi:molybdopterin-guanine dinucleotide biosynthesis protein A
MEFAGAILGGGRSSRLGQDKGLIDWNGLSLGSRGASVLWRAGLRPLYYVGEPFPADMPGQVHRLPDDQIGLGPLGGLSTLLSRAMTPVVVIAVDLVNVDETVVKSLIDHWRQDDLALALKCKDQKQPLAAIFSPGALLTLRQRLMNDQRDMLGFMDSLHARWLEWPDERPLQNINRPEDLAAVLQDK